jgi:hypothetical protein
MKALPLALLALSAASASAQQDTGVVCSYAPSQSKMVAAISGAAGGASVTIGAVAAATGLTVVTHSSGAAILTGSAGYVAGTIGAAAAVPVIVGVSLIVGGAAVTVEVICANKNHPEQVVEVNKAAAEFSRRFDDAMRTTKIAAGDMKKKVTPSAKKATFQVKQAANDAWQYVYRKSVEVSTVLGK